MSSHGTPQNPYSSASRWRHQESTQFARHAQTEHAHAAQTDGTSAQTDGEIICGPLLNYSHMQNGYWEGSLLVVLKGEKQPTLSLQRVAQQEKGTPPQPPQPPQPVLLYSENLSFWRFNICIAMEPVEAEYAYELPGLQYSNPEKPKVNHFFIPAAGESMRVMFHSCNGFSVGTDQEAFSGTPLWKDVMRKHKSVPFHVMLGGGDQIYNDGIRVNGPLRPWTDISNPKKRRDYPFSDEMRIECDKYYLENYLEWYNRAPFAIANGQIPQVNIWDDHDIIDGFGSYVHDFMMCQVFRGIGGTAHKYYMLFQHHLAPSAEQVGPQYIVGSKPGPYLEQRSLNLYMRLGARIAMLGIDARTERTRHQVNYPETYKLLFQRLRDELQAAADSEQRIEHLILLLGIPIAYPRLTWLENILRSPIIGPIRFMSRRFGVGGGLFNHFDGSVDLLDDLDDHYTAKTHKVERREMIESLQKISEEFSVRVTILGGDVHLAALGRFYSNPQLQIPVEKDHRYMTNVVSSAIVNKPPPAAVANLLARRNKIHHLNKDTDETMINLFEGKCTKPSRNFATMVENSPNSGDKTDGSLDICINVEVDQHDAEGRTEAYSASVPLLRASKGG